MNFLKSKKEFLCPENAELAKKLKNAGNVRKICLIGGKLQGVEAAYLAKEAGFYVVLVDRKETAICKCFADDFECFDVIKEPERLIELSSLVDFVLPVNEEPETISFLETIAGKLRCCLLFDFDAYRISCDKIRSKEFFRKVNVPTPADRPETPPFFIKPKGESGSIGARIVETKEELASVPEGYLIEEYIPGPIVSLEMIGNGRNYIVVKETYVHIDDVYDCCQVTPLLHNPEYRDIAYRLSEGIGLRGIMDVEAIDSPRGLKVLEIDARFPSQTPICVYYSCGVNLLALLAESADPDFGVNPEKNIAAATNPRYKDTYGILEHVTFGKDGELVSGGEHLISAGTSLRMYYSDRSIPLEILECSRPDGYRAYTIICAGKDKDDAAKIRAKAFDLIRNGVPE